MKDGIAWLCLVGQKGISWVKLYISSTMEEDNLFPDMWFKTKVGFEPFIVDKRELLNPRRGYQN
jgi:hypothetical protein